MPRRNPWDTGTYHLLHRILFRLTPKRLLRVLAGILFASEDFYSRRIRLLCGLRESEKYFAYSWIFRNSLLAGKRVIDVGCGDSLFPSELARRGCKTFAIDLSLYSAVTQHPGVNFVHADISRVPFQSATFDVLTAISSLEHIGAEEAQLAVKEISRIMNKDGVILITMPSNDKARKMERLLTHEFEVSKLEYYRIRKGKGKFKTVPPKVATDTKLGESNDLVVIHLALTQKASGSISISTNK